MEEVRKDYNCTHNPYFDTYYIRGKKTGKTYGILEHHCRGVTQEYFVAWRKLDKHWVTVNFDTEEEAMDYIMN